VYGGIQSSTLGGLATANGNVIASNSDNVTFSFDVPILQWAGSQQVASIGTSQFDWGGYHGGNSCSWTKTSASFAITTDNANCILTENYNYGAGTVTSVGSNKAGLLFTPNTTGQYYICANLTAGTRTADAPALYHLMQGATVIGHAETNISSLNTIPMCGIYNVTSIAQQQVDVQYASGNNIATVEISSPTSGIPQVAIEWTIHKLTQQVPQPVVVNSVTTNKDNVQRIVSGSINANGTVLKVGSGDWTSGNVTTGSDYIRFIPAFANNDYTCVFTTRTYLRGVSLDKSRQEGSSEYVYYTTYIPSTLAVEDNPVDFVCMGDK